MTTTTMLVMAMLVMAIQKMMATTTMLWAPLHVV
jgi:hypothetical protein